MISFQFLLYPRYEEPHNTILLLWGQRYTTGNVIPLLQTATTAAGKSVLSEENGVSPRESAPRRWAGSQGPDGSGQTALRADGSPEDLFPDICGVPISQMKFGPEGGALQSL